MQLGYGRNGIVDAHGTIVISPIYKTVLLLYDERLFIIEGK